MFHQIGALIVYIVFNFIFPNSFIINFVICLLMLMMDFWVVRVEEEETKMDLSSLHTPPCDLQTKNISGRLLVGMRWWNDVGDDQTNEGSNWRFESLAEVRTWYIDCCTNTSSSPPQGQRTINSKDSYVFWTGLYAMVCTYKLVHVRMTTMRAHSPSSGLSWDYWRSFDSILVWLLNDRCCH